MTHITDPQLTQSPSLDNLPEEERLATLAEIEEYEEGLAALSPEERAEVERMK
jgi:hypothetical protein